MRCLGWPALLLAAVPLFSKAEPFTYRLVPEQSFVQAEFLHFFTSTSRIRFGPLQGQVQIDRQAKRGEVSLRINTASADTGFGFFNARLREPDLLASTEYPEAFFVARDFRFDGDRVSEVRGEFTLRGISQGLSLKAIRFACRKDGLSELGKDGEICGGDFVGELLRSDFGASFGLPLVGDRVRLVVQVEGRR